MNPFTTRLAGAAALLAALTVSGGAIAQYYGNDMACRQYADSQVAPLQGQANANTVGSTLLGAGLGAAIGAAVGGGRGAGIGAASGAIVGTGAGVANAQNSAAYIQQAWNGYYSQCMSARAAPPPPAYGAPVAAPAATTASQLNQQQLNQTAPVAPGYPPPPPAGYPPPPPPGYPPPPPR